mmetsp:Transcript_93612/g.195184  ORF Transcript_93612/g.195184 Transcript_93612/m.195184 type:complete len:107 (-) Transcript_93612:571-891(-)
MMRTGLSERHIPPPRTLTEAGPERVLKLGSMTTSGPVLDNDVACAGGFQQDVGVDPTVARSEGWLLVAAAAANGPTIAPASGLEGVLDTAEDEVAGSEEVWGVGAG